MPFLPEGIPGFAMPRYFPKRPSTRTGRTRTPLRSLSKSRLSPGRTPKVRRTSRGIVICPLLVIRARFCTFAHLCLTLSQNSLPPQSKLIRHTGRDRHLNDFGFKGVAAILHRHSRHRWAGARAPRRGVGAHRDAPSLGGSRTAPTIWYPRLIRPAEQDQPWVCDRNAKLELCGFSMKLNYRDVEGRTSRYTLRFYRGACRRAAKFPSCVRRGSRGGRGSHG